MLLCELFDSTSGSVMKDLRQAVLDFLTPKAAHKLNSVTVSSVLEFLRGLDSGLIIDRALVMDVCDPARLPMVKKIDGNMIYLDMPDKQGEERIAGIDDEMADEQRVDDMAKKHATNAVKK